MKLQIVFIIIIVKAMHREIFLKNKSHKIAEPEGFVCHLKEQDSVGIRISSLLAS